MVFDLYFDTLDSMHAALASPVRALVREQIGKAMSAFTGKVYHLVLEEGPAAAWRALTTLITGAGLVGWLTAELLAARGDEVVLVDIRKPALPDRPNLAFMRCDVTDLTTLAEIVTRFGVWRIVAYGRDAFDWHPPGSCPWGACQCDGHYQRA